MYKTLFDVKFKKLNRDAIIPYFKHSFDSGFDFHSIEDIEIKYGIITPVHTGLSIQLPNPEESFPFILEIQVRPRSGLSMKNGIMVVNSPGTIDNTYTGEIIILLTTIIPNNIFVINKGDRIAQGVICPILSTNTLNFMEVDELNSTERNVNGFGSTGVK